MTSQERILRKNIFDSLNNREFSIFVPYLFKKLITSPNYEKSSFPYDYRHCSMGFM